MRKGGILDTFLECSACHSMPCTCSGFLPPGFVRLDFADGWSSTGESVAAAFSEAATRVVNARLRREEAEREYQRMLESIMDLPLDQPDYELLARLRDDMNHVLSLAGCDLL